MLETELLEIQQPDEFIFLKYLYIKVFDIIYGCIFKCLEMVAFQMVVMRQQAIPYLFTGCNIVGYFNVDVQMAGLCKYP